MSITRCSLGLQNVISSRVAMNTEIFYLDSSVYSVSQKLHENWVVVECAINSNT